MIAGIGKSGQLDAIYPQYQLNPIKPIAKFDVKEPTDRLKPEQETFKPEVPEQLKDAKSVSYSQNPYDQARKAVENTLLLGQNLDFVA